MSSAYKQIIIVRKDLQMSHGKMAAQVSHASMAFLTNSIRENAKQTWQKDSDKYAENLFRGETTNVSPRLVYNVNLEFDQELFEDWFLGPFTKCILEAKNKNALLKAAERAEEIGLQEGKDFFLIRDNCYTELTPEEDGRCLTCIGFRPMPTEKIDIIGKKYQLYKG